MSSPDSAPLETLLAELQELVGMGEKVADLAAETAAPKVKNQALRDEVA